MADSVRAIDDAIGHFMVDQKINREQMANLMDMSPNTLRGKREGKTDWTWSEILHLCDLLGTTPDELTGFKPAS